MEFSKKIQSSVVVSPDRMDNIQENIIKSLVENVKGFCMETEGYIADIEKILKVKSDKISGNNGNARFTVTYLAKVINPKVGDTIEAKVITMMNDGLLAVEGPIQVYAKIDPNDTSSNVVNEHHTCKFKILDTRFDEDQIWCVGELL